MRRSTSSATTEVVHFLNHSHGRRGNPNHQVSRPTDSTKRWNPFPLDQRNQMFRNLANGKFDDVTDRAGAVFTLSDVSLGAAFGDIDNDGHTNVLIANAAGRIRLLGNDTGNQHHWLGLCLVGGETQRDMLDARVAFVQSDGSTLRRRARADGSYASANDLRVFVGLAESATVLLVRVTWPGGRVEEWADLAVDQYWTLTQGGGQ